MNPLALPLAIGAALAVFQQQGPPAPAAGEAGWKLVDRVEVVVNDDIVTNRTLRKDLEKLERRGVLTDERARKAASSEVLVNRVKDQLSVQAGIDRGVDKALVDMQVKERLETLTERHDGIVGMSKFLQAQDLSSVEAGNEVRDAIYRDLYDQYVTGEGIDPSQRPGRDTFLRPGLLRFHFDNALDNPSNLAQIGGSPQSVVLQFLVIDTNKSGGVDPARTLALQVRERIQTGEDMGDLNDLYGESRKNRGLTEPMDEARLSRIEKGIGEFLLTAQPGDVSEPLPYEHQNTKYWRLVRLVERTQRVVPDLGAQDVQRRLTKLVKDDLREVRRARGLQARLLGSYVWPPELIKR